MANYGEQLLSKIIDNNDPAAFTRFGIDREHFTTEVERVAYDFIREYSETNRGEAPSYATFVQECDGVTYIPQVSDSYEYLTKKLKDNAGKKQLYDLLMSKSVQENFSQLEANEFASWLQDEAERIKIGIQTNVRIGTNIKTDTSKFLEEYRKRKEGKSFKIWQSKFRTINDEIGGYNSSNLYSWMGRSGRGKSIFVLEEAIHSAMQGATVLYWALEMSDFEIMARAYSSISAREGILTAKIDGVDYEAGFENRLLLTGRLSDDFEVGFETFLSTLNEIIPGNLIVRGVNEQGFIKRDVSALESDILNTKADVVVIDPIYLMDFEYNSSRVAGGDIARTAEKLRRIAGYTNCVMHIVTQAEEVRDDKDDDGNRELRVPTRAEMKKSKAILEISALTIGIDSLDGRALCACSKGRNGGEGIEFEVIFLPNYGIVREIEVGEAAASQFNF